MIYADGKVKQKAFETLASSGTYLTLYPCPPYLQVSGRFDPTWMTNADDKVKQRLYQQSRDEPLTKRDPIWPFFDIFRDFIYVHFSCKCQEHSIKTEWVTLMTKQNRDFFQQSRDVTLKLGSWSGLFLNCSEISSMSTLSASFRNIRLELNELRWWQSQTEAFFSNQGDVTLRLMIWYGQFSNLSEILSISSLSASLRNI